MMMTTTEHPVYTIGHSDHSIEAFLALLADNGVNMVVDARSSPHSRWVPHFNPDSLEPALEREGIDYAYMGKELGGRPNDRSAYDAEGRVSYERAAMADDFADAIASLIRQADERRIVLLCMERDPLECHRALLVARALAEQGVDVRHILWDGGIESHEELMDRLLESLGLPPQPDLFRTHEDVIADAVREQAGRVAYVAEGRGAYAQAH